MRKILTILFAVTVTSTLHAQIGGKKIKGPLVLADSTVINEGDTLHLGNGSDRRGEFVSIYQPANMILGVEEQSLKRDYAGTAMVIKFFKKMPLNKTIAVVSFGSLNYIADIQQGVELGEIKAVNSHRWTR